FLHEGRDPSSGAPASVRARVKAAARASGFRGSAREVVSEGGWILCGLGPAPSSPSRLRTALRRGIKEAASSSKRASLAIGFDRAIREEVFRSLLPHVALADYAFDRYKSTPRVTRAGGGAVTVVPPAGSGARFATAVREAQALADGIRWVRDVGNTPGN